MKRVVVTATILLVGILGARAQAPSPAPTAVPDMKPDPAVRPRGERGMRPGGMPDRAAMAERARMGGFGMNIEAGIDRLVMALASGQEMGKRLNLTPEQVELLKRLSLEQRTKMIDLEAQLQKSGLKQAEILTADPLDEEGLMAAVEESARLRTEIAKARIQLMLDLRKALTDEQRKLLPGLFAQMRQPQGMMKPGEGRPEGARPEGLRPEGRGDRRPEGLREKREWREGRREGAGGDAPPPGEPPAPAPAAPEGVAPAGPAPEQA